MKKCVAIAISFLFLFSAMAISKPAAATSAPTQLPRNETLYVGGGLWSQPNNFNPLIAWAAVTGTIGLIYEPLFIYDPLKNKLEPWLAESGKWINDNTYEVVLKKGLTWQDGKPLTANDVKFTFDLAKKYPAISFSGIWGWLKEVKVIDNRTVQFIFSQPHYAEWKYWLYNIPIVPEHIWKNIENPAKYANIKNPVGSGMYKLYKVEKTEFILVRNDKWWGIKYYGKPAPKYLVYVLVYSNNVALSMLEKGELDWSNFFIPGIPKVKSQYHIVTWYDTKPYHLPANTVFLFMNDQEWPFNNSEFRRAIAYAIDPEEIAQVAEENQVSPANPSGLIIKYPVFKKIYSESLVKKYGFSYNPQKADEILDKLGFKWSDNHQYRIDPKTGKPLKTFTIIVPYGWTDWMEMARLISNQLGLIGIKVTPKFLDYSTYYTDLTKGTFDMAINNFGSQVYATPWEWYDWLLYPNVTPIGTPTYSGNWGRYKNKEIAQLLTMINLEKDENKRIQYYYSLEELFLKNLPYIPIIYNGAWFEASTKYWTNWPNEHNPYAYPITWQNYWQMGGVMTLLHIKPATSTSTSTSKSSTSSSSPVSTSSSTSSTTTTSSSKKSICGPAAIVGLGLAPLLLRKRKKR